MPAEPDGPGSPHAGAGHRHVAIFTAAAHSHISPLLGTVTELVRRGVRVSYATTRRFAPLVEAAGAEAVVFGSSLPSDPADWPSDARRLPLLYLADARATLPELEESFAGARPGLVLTEDPAGAGGVLAAKWGIPSMQVWTYLATPRHWSLAEPGTPGANPYAGEFLSKLAGFLADEGVRTDVREHLDAAFSGASSWSRVPSSRTGRPTATRTPSPGPPSPRGRSRGSGNRRARTSRSRSSRWAPSTTVTRSSTPWRPRRSPDSTGTS